jgi:hypothetical protein
MSLSYKIRIGHIQHGWPLSFPQTQIAEVNYRHSLATFLSHGYREWHTKFATNPLLQPPECLTDPLLQ